MPKWISKSMKIHMFLEKAEMYETICFTIENVVLGTSKSHEKSVQNLCKIDARKRHAKSMDNYAKMHPKWEPRSIQNLKNTGKNCIRKCMQNFSKFKAFLNALGACRPGLAWGRKARKVVSVAFYAHLSKSIDYYSNHSKSVYFYVIFSNKCRLLFKSLENYRSLCKSFKN